MLRLPCRVIRVILPQEKVGKICSVHKGLCSGLRRAWNIKVRTKALPVEFFIPVEVVNTRLEKRALYGICLFGIENLQAHIVAVDNAVQNNLRRLWFGLEVALSCWQNEDC